MRLSCVERFGQKELGEKAAEATARVQETMSEAAITAKIKAKMALDDSVKARSIDISTTGSTVTLQGIQIFRLADGLIVERWGRLDELGLLRQLGIVPTPDTAVVPA